METVLITGASSGIGYETAEYLAKAGYKVFGAARHTDQMEPLTKLGVTPVSIDVTDADSRSQGVESILNQAGKIDVLVNAAGYGAYGALENVTEEDAKRQFDVNVFGLMEMTKLVLPSMKANHYGKIINISSMAGRFSSPMTGWYFATKHTLETLSDSLRMEVAEFGVQVVLIEPGFLKSAFEEKAMKHLVETFKGTDYAKQASNMKRGLDRMFQSSSLSDPSLVAETILKALKSKKPRPRYLIGYMAKPIIFVNSILPTRLMDKVTKGF